MTRNQTSAVKEQQELFASAPKQEKIVNVASVPHRSPFRYAGGKTWLIPRIRYWLRQQGGGDIELIEPFAGGGIVSLSAIFEQLVGRATMVEMDQDVAAVWRVILEGDAEWLANRILTFHLDENTARDAIEAANHSLCDRAFATVVKNRVNRGGILADGASFVKRGENGKGIRSRWYPETLKRRILDIMQVRDRIAFVEGDAFEVMGKHKNRTDAVFFIDPPYTKAARRLYRHGEIDHKRLFDLSAQLKGHFLMTYDKSEEVIDMALHHGFEFQVVAMKNTHHAKKRELLIGRDLSWLPR